MPTGRKIWLRSNPLPAGHRLPLMASPVLDRHARPLGVLRLSVTARCNLACPYCCPDGEDPEGLLTLQERRQLVQTAVALGVQTLRLTGGEPLLHAQLENLITAVRPLGGLKRIALTTNGVMLPRLAADLADAGLDRITVSLDTLDQQVLDLMSGGKAKLDQILAGISAAEQAGFRQIKINTVVQRGVNDHTVMDLVEHFRGTPHRVRLIEYMDVSKVIPSITVN